MRIIDVTADNVDETGLFCLTSRRKSERYQSKQRVLGERSSSPYGVFGIVLDDLVVSDHYQLRKGLVELLDSRSDIRGGA